MTVISISGDEILQVNSRLHLDLRRLLKSWSSTSSNYDTLSECGSQSTFDLKCSKGWS